ncbi:MAG: hypothetical protein SW833_28055 [Cyanobacteriota bacterium]|nr:hypothetical protein [Cyanobacteriota bacterium]
MNDLKDLWGEISQAKVLRTPYVILKEQASQLNQKTQGLLLGEVYKSIKQNQFKASLSEQINPKKSRHQEQFVNILRIKAPSLNNYTYSVVQVEYPIALYPVKVEGFAVEGFLRMCNNEDEFEQALGEILSSEEVRKVISILLAQIQADLTE